MIVVTGATGNVGATLVRTLAAGGEEVAAVSRRPPEVLHRPSEVSHRPGDLAEPETLRAALDGADALFLLVAGERPRDVVDVAKASGVRRVVLLSSLGAGTRPDAYRHPLSFEYAVRESSLEWTVLRPGGFASNSLQWAETIRSRRTVLAPFGDVGLPVVDPVDIAEVAAAVLREDGHSGRTYELTGPASTTPRERAHAIGDAIGAPVRFVQQTRDEARAQMLGFMPEPVADGTLAILGEPLPAEQRTSPDVERILGRAPHTFAAWAARNAAAFT
jgi:uncharacterized protein YbjT (DUF2867 family)